MDSCEKIPTLDRMSSQPQLERPARPFDPGELSSFLFKAGLEVIADQQPFSERGSSSFVAGFSLVRKTMQKYAISSVLTAVVCFLMLAGCGSGNTQSPAPSQPSNTTPTTNVPAQENTSAADSVAYVYVGENTTPGEIAAFAVQADASLSPVSGSPFSAPSNYIVGNSTFLFAADRTNIFTLNRLANGGLSAASSVDASTCAGYPGYLIVGLTLDPSGSYIYPGQATSLDDCISTFAVQGNGALQFQSSVDVGYAAIWTIQFSSLSQMYYGASCARMEWVLDVFQRGSDGQLTSSSNVLSEVTPVNPPVTMSDVFTCPFASAVSAKGYLAIAYSETSLDTYQNLSANIAVYQINPSGSLKLVSYLANATESTTITALNFDPTGTYLAVAGQNGIETFNLNPDGTLAQLGTVLSSDVSFLDAKWDNAGHVYAISNAALYVFTSNGGILGLTDTPYPIPAISLAVLPTASGQN